MSRIEPTVCFHVSNNMDVEKVMRNLGCISSIVVEDGYATVQFKYWFQNAGVDRVRNPLLAGNPTNYMSCMLFRVDSRPYSVRRLDDALCKQDVEQGFNDRRKPRKPNANYVNIMMMVPVFCIAPALPVGYTTKEWESDIENPALPALCSIGCEWDIENQIQIPEQIQVQAEEQEDYSDFWDNCAYDSLLPPFTSEEMNLFDDVVQPDEEEEEEIELPFDVRWGDECARRCRRQQRLVPVSPTSTPPITQVVVAPKKIEMDKAMVIRMQQAFRCEITEEIYWNNVQNVRDQMDLNDDTDDVIDYGEQAYPKMMRKRRVVVV